MTAPSITSRTTYGLPGPGSSSHPVTMPATVALNDALVMFFTASGTSQASAAVTTPSGWSIICAGTNSGSTVLGAVFAKKAAGTEGGTTVATTTGASWGSASAITFRIDAATWSQSISDIVGGTPVAATSNPDPPSCSWAWGSVDSLAICSVHGGAANRAGVSTYPSGYSNGQITLPSSGTISATAVADKTLTAPTSPEDPGAFTYSSGTIVNVANTVVIKGIATGGFFSTGIRAGGFDQLSGGMQKHGAYDEGSGYLPIDICHNPGFDLHDWRTQNGTRLQYIESRRLLLHQRNKRSSHHSRYSCRREQRMVVRRI